MKKFACVMTFIAAVTMLVQPSNGKREIRVPDSPTSPDELMLGRPTKPVPYEKRGLRPRPESPTSPDELVLGHPTKPVPVV